MKLEIQARLARPGFTLDVDLRIEHPVTGLLGPSGSGKTTLLHLIGGLVRPDAGRITLNGATLSDSASRTFAPPHRRRLGIVFQDGRLFPHLDVRANLLYGHRLTPPSERRFGLEEIVELLELGPLLRRNPAGLSGGEHQRVTLGRAILCAPKLLLFDEPLAALDRRLKQQILPFFQKIRDVTGIPILYVSHAPREVLALTDRLVVMERGRVLGHGPIAELLETPGIVELLEDDRLPGLLR